MGRKPAILRNDFADIKQTTIDVKKNDKEALKDYVIRVNKYSGTRPISEKTLSKILRSENYEDYRKILEKDNQHKKPAKNPDGEKPMDQDANGHEEPENETHPAASYDTQNLSISEILSKILTAVMSHNPCEGSSIDGLSRNICGSLKRIKTEIEKQTDMLDTHFCNIADQIATLQKSIDSLAGSDEKKSEDEYITKLYKTFGSENVEEVKAL